MSRGHAHKALGKSDIALISTLDHADARVSLGTARSIGWIALLGVYFFWGTTYLAIRVADQTTPPFLVAASRYLMAGALLYLPLRSAEAGTRSARRAHWRSAAITGTLMLLGGNGLLTLGEVTLPAGIAALIVATVPLWLIVIDAIFVARAVPAAPTLLGLALGITGIAVLARPTDIQQIDLPATAVVLVASILWAAGSLYGKHAPHPPNAFLATAQQMLAGGAACLLVSLLRGELSTVQVTASGAASVGYLVVFGSIIGLTAYTYALRSLPTAVVSTYALANPVVAVALGALMLGEALTVQTLLATAIILGGIGLILRSEGTAH